MTQRTTSAAKAVTTSARLDLALVRSCSPRHSAVLNFTVASANPATLLKLQISSANLSVISLPTIPATATSPKLSKTLQLSM